MRSKNYMRKFKKQHDPRYGLSSFDQFPGNTDTRDQSRMNEIQLRSKT